ncbi:MAG: hypothetical protein ACTSWQ_06440 [Candidatus Thorarchaeota archaeon]
MSDDEEATRPLTPLFQQAGHPGVVKMSPPQIPYRLSPPEIPTTMITREQMTDSSVQEILKPFMLQIADMNGLPKSFENGEYRVRPIGVKVIVEKLDREKSKGNWKKYNSICITSLSVPKDGVKVSGTYSFSK